VLGLLYGTASFIYTMINADDLSHVLVTEIVEPALENARRLRIVGYAMAGGAIFKFLMYLGAVSLFRSGFVVAGAAIPWMVLIRIASSPGLLLGGIIVIVISEVFRLGNQLREEQELTV
jgi:hypothetical protein